VFHHFTKSALVVVPEMRMQLVVVPLMRMQLAATPPPLLGLLVLTSFEPVPVRQFPFASTPLTPQDVLVPVLGPLTCAGG
jgi:hypothetical protein